MSSTSPDQINVDITESIAPSTEAPNLNSDAIDTKTTTEVEKPVDDDVDPYAKRLAIIAVEDTASPTALIGLMSPAGNTLAHRKASTLEPEILGPSVLSQEMPIAHFSNPTTPENQHSTHQSMNLTSKSTSPRSKLERAEQEREEKIKETEAETANIFAQLTHGKSKGPSVVPSAHNTPRSSVNPRILDLPTAAQVVTEEKHHRTHSQANSQNVSSRVSPRDSQAATVETGTNGVVSNETTDANATTTLGASNDSENTTTTTTAASNDSSSAQAEPTVTTTTTAVETAGTTDIAKKEAAEEKKASLCGSCIIQ